MIQYFPEFVDIDASTFKEKLIPNIVRSQFDSGFSKQRNEYNSFFKIISFSFYFYGDRYNEFMEFYKSVKSGALWFWLYNPVTEKKTRVRMVEFEIEFTPQDNQARILRSSIVVEAFNG